MPTFYADGLPIASAIGLHQRVNTKLLTPRCCVAMLVYTMVGTEAANDVIRLWLAPQGTTILSHLSLLTSDGIATTATVNVGDEDPTATPARYCAGANVAGANARVLFNATGNPVASVAPYTLLFDAYITATFATLAAPVAGKKLRFLTFYTGA